MGFSASGASSGTEDVVLAKDVINPCPTFLWVYCRFNGILVLVFFRDFLWFQLMFFEVIGGLLK